MSKIEKLTAIRNEIIDRLVTKETIEKTKKHHTLKKFFLKSFFKFLFLKPFKLKEIKTADDRFFTDKDGYNNVKLITCFNSAIMLAICIISLLVEDKMFFKFMFPLIVIMSIAMVLILRFEWGDLRNKTNKKFDPQNIETIKRELFNNYNEKDISSLLGGNLSKKDLKKVLIEINQIVDKEELLNKFEKVKTRKYDDITDLYNLISTIDKIIEDLKEKENEEKESEIRKINRKNLESLNNEVEMIPIKK